MDKNKNRKKTIIFSVITTYLLEKFAYSLIQKPLCGFFMMLLFCGNSDKEHSIKKKFSFFIKFFFHPSLLTTHDSLFTTFHSFLIQTFKNLLKENKLARNPMASPVNTRKTAVHGDRPGIIGIKGRLLNIEADT